MFFALFLINAAFLVREIYPIHLLEQRLMFFDLLEFNVILPSWIIYLFGTTNIFLFWMIAKYFFRKSASLIPVMIYCLSPWSIYLMVAGSFYIYLLFLSLVTILGILRLKSSKSIWDKIIFILASCILLYSHLLLLIIYPILISGVILSNIVSIKTMRLPLLIIALLCIPLFVSIWRNQIGIINIFHNQVTILSDPGYINIINAFRGESSKAGFFYVSKLVDNKFAYLSKYLIYKFIKNIVPSTFFTAQEKLLGFSFSPPIYLGFIIPFFYGLYIFITSKVFRRYLWLFLIFIIPSLFSKQLVNLNRLVLLEPFIIAIISIGLLQLIKRYKDITFRLILILIFFLVSLQYINNIFDINYREYPRYKRYFGEVLQIKDL